MQELNAPNKLKKPFCDTGLKNTIAVTTGTNIQDATYEKGFPLVTMTPISQGGVPPQGKDFNGILYEISAHTHWQNAGGQYKFDQAYATAIGGYSKGAVLQANDGLSAYVSTKDNNLTDFNTVTNADWVAYAGEAVTPAPTPTGGKFDSNNNFSFFMCQL